MTIELGALSPALSVQLAGLKKPIEKGRLHTLDKLAESLTYCYLHGLITSTEHTRAGKKLIAIIQSDITKAASPKS